jgi:predicted MFS family arabinose efflux permease
VHSGLNRDFWTIVGLYCLEGMTRGALLALIPLQLLEQFGTTQRVTFVYALVGLVSLGNSILVPFLFERFGTRQVVAIAGCFHIAAAFFLFFDFVGFKALGLVLRAAATASAEIPLMALLMQIIPRDRLSVFEPTRVLFAGTTMSISPWLGFQLFEHVAAYAPNIAAATGGALISIAALTLLPEPSSKIYKTTRLGRHAIRKFISQPRLCVAWTLAVVRTSFWAIFYIYAPIFAVVCGWTASAASALLSAGIATMICVPLWGHMVRRFGVRAVLMWGYALTGALLLLAVIAARLHPIAAPAMLFLAALSASIVDGAGNVPFMRASRVHDRAAMTGIYLTYRDAGQFGPVALFAAILLVFQLTTAFTVTAATFFAATLLSRTIHRRLS